MSKNPIISFIATVATVGALGSCTNANDTATTSQPIGEMQPMQPMQAAPPVQPGMPEHPRERFRRRRAAAEAAAQAAARENGPQQPQQAMASSTSSEYWFVASSLGIDPTTSGAFAGFDLDGMCTTEGSTSGCGAGDVVSSLDPDQNVGGCSGGSTCQGCVDNAIPIVANVLSDSEQRDIRADLTTAVNQGRAVWLVRLVAVESLQNDSWILLALYRGYSADKSCSALFSGSGNFVVSNTSLWIPGDVNYPKWFGEGTINNGRFDIRFGSSGGQSQTGEIAWNEFINVPESFELKTYQLRLRATLNPSGLSATQGNAGTWARASEFRESLSRAFPQARGSVDGIVPLAADLPYTGQCGGYFGEPLGAIGIGLNYSLVAATITGTTNSPPAGFCGSP